MKKFILVLLILYFKAIACDFNFDTLPLHLSKTCLYKNIQSKQLNSRIFTFTPQFELWTDGARKNRWLYFPQGSVINTDDANNWVFPVGTMFWKEFSKKGLRLETRFLKKIKTGKVGSWIFGTYLWNEAETEAKLIEFGQSSARGTNHDIPAMSECQWCHGKYLKNPDGGWFKDIRVQGFDAIQLAKDGSKLPECNTYKNPNPALQNNALKLNLDYLVVNSLVSNSHNWREVKPLMPGSEIEKEALGYLHANCSSCHGETGQAQGLGIDFKHDLSKSSITRLPSYLTTFKIPTRMYRRSANMMRLAPQDIQNSAVWLRVETETPGEMMPKIGRKSRDPYGVCILKKYVEEL